MGFQYQPSETGIDKWLVTTSFQVLVDRDSNASDEKLRKTVLIEKDNVSKILEVIFEKHYL